jgi:Uricase
MSLAARDNEPGLLATARYGKDKVRVFRVVRDSESKVHDVVEYNVTVLVEGAIETRCEESPPLLAGTRIKISFLFHRPGWVAAATRKRTIAS